VTRRQRDGAFSAAEAAAALVDCTDDLAHQYRQVDITSRLITQAIERAKTYALRGYDAIQLAAVLTVHVAREAQGFSRLTLVSADHELNAAAVAEGLLVDDPNVHGTHGVLRSMGHSGRAEHLAEPSCITAPSAHASGAQRCALSGPTRARVHALQASTHDEMVYPQIISTALDDLFCNLCFPSGVCGV
jgi:predicted nucleic acid-binding protein